MVQRVWYDTSSVLQERVIYLYEVSKKVGVKSGVNTMGDSSREAKQSDAEGAEVQKKTFLIL